MPNPGGIVRQGPQREVLRERGQFWTPDWVADAMVAYVLLGGARTIFDPAVGEGAFYRAAFRVGQRLGREVAFVGTEIDATLVERVGLGRPPGAPLPVIQVRDYVLDPPEGRFAAIVANPPYIRHHRLSRGVKEQLRLLSRQILGRALDGRAGLHVYFLLRALQRLEPDGGRLAFIVSADVCEGVFAPVLWEWIASKYCLDSVITFAPEASPFPGIDTNPVILLIRSGHPATEFYWARCGEHGAEQLFRWVVGGFREDPGRSLVVERRSLAEALRTGLTRPPRVQSEDVFRLADFATVLRGIATGANEFFFLTRAQARALRIPNEFLVPAIGRTRDVPGDEVSADVLDWLDRSGRPTLLFCPDGRPIYKFPDSVRAYLAKGEELGLPSRPLIRSRRPWYKMEVRKPPPILFAYLGRRNARFVRNLAGVVPLTGFLCVYPKSDDAAFIERLWQTLTHPSTIDSLRWVGKSYGSGCIKVEPRALERLPLSQVGGSALLERIGPCQRQFDLPLDTGEQGAGGTTVSLRP